MSHVEKGLLKRVSKDRYYKPRQTRFRKVIGYLTTGEFFSDGLDDTDYIIHSDRCIKVS